MKLHFHRKSQTEDVIDKFVDILCGLGIHAVACYSEDGCDVTIGDLPPNLGCKRPPAGWWCSRTPEHEGPCAAYPGVDV